MAEYINREELLRRMERVTLEAGFSGYHLAKAIISHTPAADVAPVVHGRWGEYERFPMMPSLDGYPCSQCGSHEQSKRAFCPNCGAKMNLEADNVPGSV